VIPIASPFVVWGFDMVGPLKTVPRGYNHPFVMMNKFTKWIEAKPIVKISVEQTVKFFVDIIY